MLSLLAVLLASTAASDPPTMVVAGLVAPDLQAHVRAILLADLRTAAGRSSAYVMVTPEAMGEVSKELERQLSGGCAEASCVAELAELAQAQFILSARVVKLGSRYQLTLKNVARNSMAVVGTSQRSFQSIEQLQDSIPLQMRLALKEAERPAQVRITAVYHDRLGAEQVSLYWNDRALGISPYDGELPAGAGTLRASWHGKTVERDYTLRAGKRHLIALDLGRNPLMVRAPMMALGFVSVIGGATLTAIGWRESSALGRPHYGYSWGADAAFIIGSGMLMAGALIR